MPDLPAKTDFTDNGTTEGGFRTSFDSMLDFITNIVGSKDGRVEVFSGTDGTRPSATEGGWIRYNSTNNVMDVSISTTWHRLVHSVVDVTWKWFIETGQTYGFLVKNSSGSSSILQVESSVGSIRLGVDPDEGFIHSVGNRPLRVFINGVPTSIFKSDGSFIATGNVTSTGSVTVSDRRFKKNIKPITNGLELISKMKGYTFTKKRGNELSAGVIAQELQKVFPEAIRTFSEEDTEYLSVEYTAIIGPLINAIQELEARVKELEK